MTTIVYRNGVLAADTALTTERAQHPLRRSYCRKLKTHTAHYVQGYQTVRAAFASAGAADGTLLIDERIIAAIANSDFLDEIFGTEKLELRWPGTDAFPEYEDADDEPCSIVVVSYDAGKDSVNRTEAFVVEHAGWRRIESDFEALGSDAGIAYGALHAGADAVTALRAACIYGAYTAAPIHYVQPSNNMILRVE